MPFLLRLQFLLGIGQTNHDPDVVRLIPLGMQESQTMAC